ncbi:MAG: WGR domain-containing protein [Chloroflexota bacterium]
MIVLKRLDPTENVNRWYLVSIQPTLFHPCAVIVAWGRCDNDFQRWRAIPVEDQAQAERLAERIVSRKIRRGYHVSKGAFRSLSFESPREGL